MRLWNLGGARVCKGSKARGQGRQWGGARGMAARLPSSRLCATVWPPAPAPADVFPSATHVSIRYLQDNPLSGTIPIELSLLSSMQQL